MNRKSICAHITAVTILVSLIGAPAMAAGPGKIATGMGPIERSIQAQKWTVELHRSTLREQSQLRMASGPRPASRKMIFGVIGFIGGVFAGGALGHLADAGHQDGYGALYGAAIGAVAGPIVGVWAASR